jgi:hypothetical protein
LRFGLVFVAEGFYIAISHAGFTFLGITTHQLPEFQPWEFEDLEVRIFGVRNAQEIRDATHARTIFCEAEFTGYSTFADLENALATIDTKINSKGTLTINNVAYITCTFKGFDRSREPAFFDGSGVNGYIQRGRLIWRQLERPGLT